MRKALAALLFVLTGAFLTVAAIIASNVFDDYKDSPDSTYIGTAAIPFGFAVLCFIGGMLALRTRSG